MTRNWTALLMGALMAVTPISVVSAQQPAAIDERIRQAAEAYDQGQFDRALELLEAAYADEPKPALLFNMAQVRRTRGDCAAARTAYRRFLDATTPDDPNRVRAERYEAEMAACAEQLTPARAIEAAPALPVPAPALPAPGRVASAAVPEASFTRSQPRPEQEDGETRTPPGRRGESRPMPCWAWGRWPPVAQPSRPSRRIAPSKTW